VRGCARTDGADDAVSPDVGDQRELHHERAPRAVHVQDHSLVVRRGRAAVAGGAVCALQHGVRRGRDGDGEHGRGRAAAFRVARVLHRDDGRERRAIIALRVALACDPHPTLQTGGVRVESSAIGCFQCFEFSAQGSRTARVLGNAGPCHTHRHPSRTVSRRLRRAITSGSGWIISGSGV
jgi:hypothetical protein